MCSAAVINIERQQYVLRLFIAGSTQRSMRAVANLKRFCEQHLAGQYDLEVIDIYQFPAKAGPAQILAAPTLIKESPLPIRRIIGDMTDEARTLATLGVPAPASA